MPLPVVDYTKEDAPQRFVQSLKETGFAILINHPIPQNLAHSIYQSWQAFFDSSENV